MKPTSSFKLSKQSKIHCCHVLDPHKRSAIRKSFIEAELMKLIQPKFSRQPKETQTQE